MKHTLFLALACLMLIMGQRAYAGTVTYVYSDPHGTPLAEADASGNITATFDYRPYGAQALGGALNGPGYTGHVNDSDTGLVYMQARYYDPAVNRFLSTDPEAITASDGFKFNRYAYANNNPSTFFDATGRATTAAMGFNIIQTGIYNPSHEFVVITNTDTGAQWVSRAGPSGAYPMPNAVSNSTATRTGGVPFFGPPMTLLAQTTSYARSAEAASTNYEVPDSAVVINMSFSQAISAATQIGNVVNAAQIPYRARSTNSNAYANLVYKALTGKEAPSQEKFWGSQTVLPVHLPPLPPPPPPPPPKPTPDAQERY